MSDYLLNFSGENIDEGDELIAAEFAQYIVNGVFSAEAFMRAHGADDETLYTDLAVFEAEYE